MRHRLSSILLQSCLLLLISLGQVACKNTGAVCPGTGQSKAADFSPFNDDGEPKSGKKKKGENGLVKKKQPKKLNKK